MFWYPTLKAVHLTAVALSGALFALRGLWMLADSPRLRLPWVKLVPHLIDTVLLASAVALVLLTRQYPLAHGWLSAKLLALPVYVVLGSIALKRGRQKTTRVVALAAAVATFGYIVAVAVTRQPLPFG